MRNHILITLPLTAAQKTRIAQAAPESKIKYIDQSNVTAKDLLEVNVLFGFLPPYMLQTAKKLTWLQLQTSGANLFLKPGILPCHVQLTCATGSYGPEIAEFLFALLLSLYKNLHRYRDLERIASWSDVGYVHSVYNATALIVGTGSVGGEFAKRLKAFGAYTIGIRRTAREKPAFIDEQYTLDALGGLLPRADIVALCLPETPSTIRVLDAPHIALLKKDAVVLNVGRGSAIDTNALCDALQSHRILGAGLDVVDPEPLPPQHPLWTLPNAVITPHVAGQDTLPSIMERTVSLFIRNLVAFEKNLPLENVVDRQSGYCRHV